MHRADAQMHRADAEAEAEVEAEAERVLRRYSYGLVPEPRDRVSYPDNIGVWYADLFFRQV